MKLMWLVLGPPLPSDLNSSNIIKLLTPGRTFYFIPETKEELNEWKRRINMNGSVYDPNVGKMDFKFDFESRDL